MIALWNISWYKAHTFPWSSSRISHATKRYSAKGVSATPDATLSSIFIIYSFVFSGTLSPQLSYFSNHCFLFSLSKCKISAFSMLKFLASNLLVSINCGLEVIIILLFLNIFLMETIKSSIPVLCIPSIMLTSSAPSRIKIQSANRVLNFSIVSKPKYSNKISWILLFRSEKSSSRNLTHTKSLLRKTALLISSFSK